MVRTILATLVALVVAAPALAQDDLGLDEPIGGPPVEGEPIGEFDGPVGGPPVGGEPIGEGDEPIGGPPVDGEPVDEYE